MWIRLSRQTVGQAALTVVVLTLLCAVYLARPQPAVSPLHGFASQSVRNFQSDEGSEQDNLEELRTLPAYRSVQRAVAELNAARAALLKAAAADAAATRDAAEDYHGALVQVRSDVAALKDYVDPAEFQRCLYVLFMPHAEAELSREPIQESLLGILPRVSLLPEENLP